MYNIQKCLGSSEVFLPLVFFGDEAVFLSLTAAPFLFSDILSTYFSLAFSVVSLAFLPSVFLALPSNIDRFYVATLSVIIL